MKQHRKDQGTATLDALIQAITVDANSDDEKLRAFRQAFEDNIVVPCDAFVIGEPVSVRAFDYDGNERRGLTATCCREGGAERGLARDAEMAEEMGAHLDRLTAANQAAGMSPAQARHQALRRWCD